MFDCTDLKSYASADNRAEQAQDEHTNASTRRTEVSVTDNRRHLVHTQRPFEIKDIMSGASYSYQFEATRSTTTPQGTTSHSVRTNPSGTTVTEHSSSASTGQSNTTTTYYPADSNTGNSGGGRILSAEEAEKKYLEAMEDEYAKREGGA
ncbi:hypothetical protein Dda_5202 [Drechslerella dactyloides]|uniref:Uncharacterized protein n=1 Tax=Drechslerella dactyloides TaxID=74499 RepID=A0AAD6IVM9_DREDA|nr:hypothetical protein Dda_5202 [Drechslerella dactyloides]